MFQPDDGSPASAAGIRVRTLVWAAFGSALLLTVSTPSRAASFDCARARTPHEAYICRTPALNAADARMSVAYQAAVAAFPVRGFVQATQRRFLLFYASCDERGGDGCIAAVEERIAVLRSMNTGFVYSDTAPKLPFDPDMGVFWIDGRDDGATLHYFGGFMPDMNTREPFPDGFVCDDAIPLARSPSGWTGTDVSVTEDKIVARISCSPRNGLVGEFRRVR